MSHKNQWSDGEEADEHAKECWPLKFRRKIFPMNVASLFYSLNRMNWFTSNACLFLIRIENQLPTTARTRKIKIEKLSSKETRLSYCLWIGHKNFSGFGIWSIESTLGWNGSKTVYKFNSFSKLSLSNRIWFEKKFVFILIRLNVIHLCSERMLSPSILSFSKRSLTLTPCEYDILKVNRTEQKKNELDCTQTKERRKSN